MAVSAFGSAGLLVIVLLLAAQRGDTAESLVIREQGSFFVGGRTIRSNTLSTLPDLAMLGSIAVEGMYVRYQIPADSKHLPVTLIHGGCLTGKSWETTPDGRMGWDEYFVRKGRPTYVVDQISRGRSAADLTELNSVRLGRTPPNQTPQVIYVGQESAWVIFRFGPEYGRAFAGLRFPLDAKGQFWKQMVPDWNATEPFWDRRAAPPNPNVQALSELVGRLKSTILISHSQSGGYPFQVAALTSQGVAGIISIEPPGCPATTQDHPLHIPTLIMFGDFGELSPYWAPRIQSCREFVQRVRLVGGDTELVVLPEIGIKGNSHMLMQDRNSLEIAGWVEAWIEKAIEHRTKRSATSTGRSDFDHNSDGADSF